MNEELLQRDAKCSMKRLELVFLYRTYLTSAEDHRSIMMLFYIVRACRISCNLTYAPVMDVSGQMSGTYFTANDARISFIITERDTLITTFIYLKSTMMMIPPIDEDLSPTPFIVRFSKYLTMKGKVNVQQYTWYWLLPIMVVMYAHVSVFRPSNILWQ